MREWELSWAELFVCSREQKCWKVACLLLPLSHIHTGFYCGAETQEEVPDVTMEASLLSEIVKSLVSLYRMPYQDLLNLHHEHQQQFEVIQAAKWRVLQILMQPTAPLAVAPPSTASPASLALTLTKMSSTDNCRSWSVCGKEDWRKQVTFYCSFPASFYWSTNMFKCFCSHKHTNSSSQLSSHSWHSTERTKKHKLTHCDHTQMRNITHYLPVQATAFPSSANTQPYPCCHQDLRTLTSRLLNDNLMLPGAKPGSGVFRRLSVNWSPLGGELDSLHRAFFVACECLTEASVRDKFNSHFRKDFSTVAHEVTKSESELTIQLTQLQESVARRLSMPVMVVSLEYTSSKWWSKLLSWRRRLSD